ncbi:retinaldehyde-binding protein 1-like, partial [Onthophagus taurus]|uniref:retinaldehyde-binding protein 1-like n=1 Tax=Onthophagus taurus TaxID=166361 RepID=UPI0039BE1D24
IAKITSVRHHRKNENKNKITKHGEPSKKQSTFYSEIPIERNFAIEDNPLSEEGKLIAYEELRETPENVAKGLKELRAFLERDKTIRYDTDDEFLKIFLRPTKFYASSAYDLMKRVANFREKYKDLFDGLLPEHEKLNFINNNIVNILVNRDHKGRRVLIINAGTWNPSKVSSDQILRILYLLHLAAVQEPETQVRGLVVIMDYKNFGMKQLTNFTLPYAMKLLSFMQDASVLRLKEMHFINNPKIFETAWMMIKPLLNKKLCKRLFFHESKMSSLHKFIPPSYLPSDYGGDLPAIFYSGIDWYPAIEGYLDFFKKWNSCGKVRPVNQKK